MTPAIYLVTGPMAAGKTTVARLLAARFERGVHLEGDIFRRSIVTGRREVTPELEPEAMAQLRLRYRISAAAADLYADEGFTVALEDVVAGPLLRDYVSLFRMKPVHVAVLLPSVETVRRREAERLEQAYGEWPVQRLHDGFARDTPRIGLWLDSSQQTPDETVDAILAGFGAESG